MFVHEGSAQAVCVCLTLYLLVSSADCCLLITLANNLYTYQARQIVGPDLDPKCLTLYGILEIRDLEIKSSRQKMLACKVLKCFTFCDSYK